MNKHVWTGVLFLFVMALVAFGAWKISEAMTSERLQTEHQEELSHAASSAFIRGVCLSSDQSLGDCAAEVEMGNQDYLVQNGVLLKLNGDDPAETAFLGGNCTGVEEPVELARGYESGGFEQIPESMCRVRLPRAETAPVSTNVTPAE